MAEFAKFLRLVIARWLMGTAQTVGGTIPGQNSNVDGNEKELKAKAQTPASKIPGRKTRDYEQNMSK
jgi:hypothetical protein